jgi:FK506-binding nuclear protein
MLDGHFLYNYRTDFLLQYESDSCGEDVVGTESEDSSEYDSEDDEYDSEDEHAGYFIDDSDSDYVMYPSPPVPNSGGKFIYLLY